ncbi:hypothetical protein C7271_11795 [filamentous cyanobacterium CCP5]|nr:hypothetical protein C7271_11795 [filamentous cyanobacterium CCP5]
MNTELQSESAVPGEDPMTSSSENLNSESSFSGDEASQQWQQIWNRISGLLGNLPDYVTDFFKEYQRPLITVGLILAALISVRVVLAILRAVNDIPLLAPLFELIGLAYSGWFIYRYLLRAANRQELIEDFNSLKAQVLGKHS